MAGTGEAAGDCLVSGRPPTVYSIFDLNEKHATVTSGNCGIVLTITGMVACPHERYHVLS